MELLVTLSVSLETSQRIALVNGLFINNVSLNDSYNLTVSIVMNQANPELCKYFSSKLAKG